MINNKDKTKADSFLNEFQLEGKGGGDGKIALEDWADSMDGVNKIVTPETRAAYKNVDWDNIPRHNMALYCHDCRAIVPAELKTFGRRTREVCGQCRSKKISKGREDALKVFYHLVDRDGAEIEQKPRPKRDFSKSNSRTPQRNNSHNNKGTSKNYKGSNPRPQNPRKSA